MSIQSSQATRGVMRRALDALYDGAAVLAALCMIGLLGMVMLSIVQRLLGFHVPGTDAYAGYLMAGAGFLALAHTLKRGEHIRVTLILSHLSAGKRHLLELFALLVAVFLAIMLAWFSVRLAWQSLRFNDISTMSDGTPLWIPQLSMAAGTIVLAVAFLDELQLEWRGLRVTTGNEEALHNE